MNGSNHHTGDDLDACGGHTSHQSAVPSSEPIKAAFQDARVRQDIKTLARFITIFCDGQHRHALREPLTLRAVDVECIAGRPLVLCVECRRLMTHAMMKRAMCPFDPKPACKHCVKHCYVPRYRAQIRQVMRYAGRKLLLSGRLDYLVHLLF